MIALHEKFKRSQGDGWECPNKMAAVLKVQQVGQTEAVRERKIIKGTFAGSDGQNATDLLVQKCET